MSEEKKVKKERKVAKKREPIKREKVVEAKPEPINKVPHPFIKHFEYKNVEVGDKHIAKLFYDFAVELDNSSKNNKLKDVEFRKLLDCRNRLIRVNL